MEIVGDAHIPGGRRYERVSGGCSSWSKVLKHGQPTMVFKRFSLCLLLLGGLLASCAVAQEPLTFFGWSDQHVTTAGKADHLIPAIEAMNALLGTAYPKDIGGTVAEPAFVFGCGDMTEWPTVAAKDAYAAAIKRLKFPTYDIVGNHDEGGKSPSPTVKNWMIARHGALRYTFEKQGVHFLAVFSEYDESLNNPAQPISPQALEFIRNELAKIPQGQPVIIALHLCLDAITNKEELVKSFGQSNILLVLGGHYHKATVSEYRGYRFVQLPSPQSTSLFTVIRISPDRIVALPYDYKKKAWDENPRIRLDVPLRKATN
jgi:hypothetical protein